MIIHYETITYEVEGRYIIDIHLTGPSDSML